jgi:biopolymer transport protein ExbD
MDIANARHPLPHRSARFPLRHLPVFANRTCAHTSPTPPNGPHWEFDLREAQSTSILDLITVWLIVIGASIMLLTLLHWPPADRLPEISLPRIFPDMPLRNVFRWRRHRPLPHISQPTNFGFFFGSVLWVLISIFMALRTPRTLFGLSITFPAQRYSPTADSPWPQTLAIYVDGDGNFFLNTKPIPRQTLRTRLQQELAHRPVWTVYFEAHNNSSYSDAVYAIDTIQGLGAQVVWLTPKLRRRLATQKAAL